MEAKKAASNSWTQEREDLYKRLVAERAVAMAEPLDQLMDLLTGTNVCEERGDTVNFGNAQDFLDWLGRYEGRIMTIVNKTRIFR